MLIVEREPSSFGLTEQLNQHRHLHRAGGVERRRPAGSTTRRGRSSVRNATATSAPLFLISAWISADIRREPRRTRSPVARTRGQRDPASARSQQREHYEHRASAAWRDSSRSSADLWHLGAMRSALCFLPRGPASLSALTSDQRLLPDDDGAEGERRRQRHHQPPDGLHQGGAGAAEISSPRSAAAAAAAPIRCRNSRRAT